MDRQEGNRAWNRATVAKNRSISCGITVSDAGAMSLTPLARKSPNRLTLRACPPCASSIAQRGVSAINCSISGELEAGFVIRPAATSSMARPRAVGPCQHLARIGHAPRSAYIERGRRPANPRPSKMRTVFDPVTTWKGDGAGDRHATCQIVHTIGILVTERRRDRIY